MDRAYQSSRKPSRRPAKGGFVDGFVEEHTIYGGYNQSPVTSTGESGPGILRLLDNFTLYVQTDDEGSEELVDLQDFTADGVGGLPLKVTGTILDHRLCSQQSVYDARSSSRMKVRLHAVRDWVVDYFPHVTVWLITDWAWYRLLSPSRIYKQIYDPTESKTELAAACQLLLSSHPQLAYQAAVQQLAQGVAVPPQQADPSSGLPTGGVDNQELHHFQEQTLLEHAAFVVQQLAPIFGRHAYRNFLADLAQKAGISLADFIGTGQRLALSAPQAAPASLHTRPAPQKSFLVPMDTVPSLLLVWDFCQRYGQLLRLPPFPFARLELACLNHAPNVKSEAGPPSSPPQAGQQPPPSMLPVCKQCDAAFSSPKALRQHCTASGHDPNRAPRSGVPKKQRGSLAAPKPAVALALTVQPLPEELEMERWGPVGQGRLLCDLHSALVRVLEGLDEDLMEAPTMAGYGSATDLAPADSYKPLLGAAWPELARRYLQEHGALGIGQDAVEAAVRLKGQEYNTLSVHDRALVMEALVTLVANTELLRNHLRHLEPEGTPMVNRGGALGQDAAGNVYHHLGGQSARGNLYVESAGDMDWGWYTPQQIPELIAWLESGSEVEQQLAEDIYGMYQPVLRVSHQGQDEQQPQPYNSLWPAPEATLQHSTTPSVLLDPKDGYKGSLPTINGALPLQQELLRLLAIAPFWNKDLDWLQSRAAVQALLPKALTGPDFARLLWLIEELLYEDMLKGSGWGRRRGWFREQLEAVRNISQAAALGGQLAAHCRRESDLGLISPQELLQSAQRQRCYLGYIPQPPQDVVLFKSGFEAHVRQQERNIPPISPWIDSWAPMQDCKVKQMACVVEPMSASARQSALRAQSQPGVPARPLDPPCSAWLLLEKDLPLTEQKPTGVTNDEIDWTHFTFQHGFRQLPQQASLADLAAPAAGVSYRPHVTEAHMTNGSEAGTPSNPQMLPVNPKSDPADHAMPGGKSEDSQQASVKHDVTEPAPTGFRPNDSSFGPGVATFGPATTGHAAADDQMADPGTTTAGLPHRGLPNGANAPFQAQISATDSNRAGHAEHAGATAAGLQRAELRQEAEDVSRSQEVDAQGEGEGENEEGSDEEGGPEGPRVTRSRRSNAAELYMLDHGSQLVPKKIRQALQRPTQKPARLWNALDDPVLAPSGDPDKPTPVGPSILLPGESKVRFWLKERSLLAVALHVKPGMTRAAEFLVPAQLCNKALCMPWPAGMAVKMPFTGTVLDHLTKPRTDTRFCTGLLQRALPALRPAVVAPPPAASTAAQGGTTPQLAAASGSTTPDQPTSSTSASLGAATAPAAVKEEPNTPDLAVKQEAGAAVARITQAAGTAAVGALGQAPPLQQAGVAVPAPQQAHALPQAGNPLTQGQAAQAYEAASHANLAQASGVNQTQASEPGAQRPDPWNALDIMWDSDTPPGWPRLICPWQVLEDRGGELRKAKERYRQAEAEKREKARQEALARDAARRAAAERSQQAAAALQAERMRRALEARAVVAQVAEQKEAGRAALAAAQGNLGQHVTGPQMLAGVVPQLRPGGAAAMANLGLPAGSLPTGAGDTASYYQHLHHQDQQSATAGALLPTGSVYEPQALSQQPGQLQPIQSQPLSQGTGLPNQYPSLQAGTHPHLQLSNTPPLPQQATADASGHIANQLPNEASLAEASRGGESHPAGQGTVAGALASEVPPSDSPPAQATDSGTHKRGRSADADGDSSPPRAKKNKPAAEGYRERWLAGKPRAQAKTWCSMLCSVCEKGADESELLVCKGPCLRAFHPACLGLPRDAPADPSSQAAWFCPECLHGRVKCFVCGEPGAGFDDPTMRKCSLGVCGRFYHLKCAQSLELTQMAKKGAHFRCPQHYCDVCHKSGDGVDMVKCIRCPTAYHSSCMPKDIQRLVPHAKVVLCAKHGNEPSRAYQLAQPPDPSKMAATTFQGRAVGLQHVNARDTTGVGVASVQQQQQQQQQGVEDYEHNAEAPSNAVGPMQRMLLQHEDDAGLYDDEADIDIGNG